MLCSFFFEGFNIRYKHSHQHFTVWNADHKILNYCVVDGCCLWVLSKMKTFVFVTV